MKSADQDRVSEQAEQKERHRARPSATSGCALPVRFQDYRSRNVKFDLKFNRDAGRGPEVSFRLRIQKASIPH